LRATAAGESHDKVAVGRAIEPPRVVFLYSGQGSQTPGMGKALYESEPVFRTALDRCDDILRDDLVSSAVNSFH
jgi:myxalamid-type polyketide synthase MxaC